MSTALSMAAMAFLITIVLGYPYLTYLRRAGLGKKVRIEGPSTHIEKTGTPTMGGLLVTAVVLALTVCLTLILYRENGRSILLPMAVMALTTLLGWYDDRLVRDPTVAAGDHGHIARGQSDRWPGLARRSHSRGRLRRIRHHRRPVRSDLP